jgi:hypothetical protein
VFEPLREPEQFSTAYQHPVMRTVAWENGADLAPEFLLKLMRGSAGTTRNDASASQKGDS